MKKYFFCIISLMLAWPAAVRAQFNFITNADNTITITRYTGSSGTAAIPDTTNGLPVTCIAGNVIGGTPLTNLTIPNGVLNIDDFALSCGNLVSITIPDSVTNIGTGAFYSSTELANVIIGTNVARIGDRAFLWCQSLTNAAIGPNTTNVGVWAFGNCPSLPAITVNAANPAYCSAAGVLFDKNTNTLLQFPGGKAGPYAVPGTVTNIGTGAFAYCTQLTNVVLSNSVVIVGTNAFTCSGLTSLVIPDSVAVICSNAFGSCASLGSVVLGNHVTDIEINAFDGCSGLGSIIIPDSVTNIGQDAFYHCSGLTNVTIGNGVASIGDDAFCFCSSLASVTIGNSVTNVGINAFVFCYLLTGAYFQGNAPPDNGTSFWGDGAATIYYLPGTTGWGVMFGSRPTALWTLSYPVILTSANGNTNLGVQNNQFGFNVSWATNLSVIVLAATNLANPVWTPVATNALTNGTFYFSDPQWTNYPGRFYRLRSP